ncbi:mechanosensitive ion channel protein MscL [Frondihabitans sp. PAMC 28766]|uniref:large conductance mechanosensitive channel protein MscL n=1 Tax=Frondihabitans sp. PAMC 28766 TaxID=1795630 RepID=UPI00078C0A03|nr:large conductance mechanosensitive channel protein MscL [Frondihabitans sp. PAMC 28766]AMM20078.1 mechanosensitive ion channel protein MscL [Frondihabitans sp. PAMC 28766]
MKGFKEFILRGNVIDLAVAVVIGAAFTAIVTSLVTNIFNPLIGAIFNASMLDKALVVSIPTASGGHAQLMFGAVIGAAINFVIIAAVVYFCLVLPINHLLKTAFAKQKETEGTPQDVPPTDVEILSEIRDLLRAQNTSLNATGGSHAAEVPPPAPTGTTGVPGIPSA